MNRLVASTGVALVLSCTDTSAQIYPDNLPAEHPAIQYFQKPVDDPVARLARRLEAGELSLDFRKDGLGYLPSLLERLEVNPDSQGLVFSKTSSQAAGISPRTPRAIYFGDDVAIGFVRGAALIEVAAHDPRQGIVFYTLDAQESERPKFTRARACLQCHQGPATAGVPGWFISSVYPSASGRPHRSDAIVTDHRTLFEERWGGWYVNGTHGAQTHRGNAVAMNPARPRLLETHGTQNLTTLVMKLDTSAYLTSSSDIVALMTFEHQTQMTNLITRLGWKARIAGHGEETTDPVSTELEQDVEEVVRYMLFADEAPLREPVQGVSSFTTTFPQRGPHDSAGRSLRDFDLETRLFRYPLSYMVYSPAFDALPDNVREPLYERLHGLLTETDASDGFSSLSNDDRRAILDILRDTKPNLPAYWRPSTEP